MKEKMRESLFLCVLHDVVMLNPVARGAVKFMEGPLGRRIRRRVEKEAVRARVRARDTAEDILRAVVHKITF